MADAGANFKNRAPIPLAPCMAETAKLELGVNSEVPYLARLLQLVGSCRTGSNCFPCLPYVYEVCWETNAQGIITLKR
jgi:hypothetical protein